MYTRTAMKTRRNPTAAYTAIGLETGVPNADPHRLVLLLAAACGGLMVLALVGRKS